jgi:hypothetical protein
MEIKLPTDRSEMSPAQGAAPLSEAKLRLLQRYLSGSVSQTVAASRPITPRPSGEPALLSLSQEQLVLRESSMADIPPLYNECITLRMEGPLEVALLERSLAEIIRRHEIWRTSYDLRNGRLVQVVHPACEMRLPMVDLRGFPGESLEEEVLRLATEETRLRFDLSRGPLLRAILMKTGEADYRLSVVAHLSIVDGISVYQLFPSELAALYTAFSAGKPSPLPELPLQYADYAYWQRQWLSDDELARQLTYWREQLAGDLPVLQWPTDRPRTAVRTYRGAIRPFALGRPLTDALKELTRREGVTLFTTLLASFACLIYCYTSQLDLVIGTPSTSGRKRSEFQTLLGYFLNPVALRIDFQDDPSLRDLLLRAQKVIAEAISYDDLPIEVLAKELQPKPDPGRSPFFTPAISLQPTSPDEATGWHVTSMDADSGGTPWDLYLAFINKADGMIGRVQYNPDLFTTLTISQMLGDLQKVMKAIVSDPSRRISSLRPAMLEPQVIVQTTTQSGSAS